ncbi:TPA: hypothetical protein ACF2DD_002767 [Clostridium perfringens]|nr:hypothetical protein [Clostridium perfringens]
MSFVKTIPLTSTLSNLYPSAGFTFTLTSSPVFTNTSPPVSSWLFSTTVPFPSVVTFITVSLASTLANVTFIEFA